MFTFHKPKVFRSGSGCCICKAKSSSSRFTDSKKYEHVFERCFDLLDQERSGEICNACVLLVKRFLKLPSGSTRNWNHVVDARSGPGIKSLVKSKNKNKAAAAAAALKERNTPDPETPEKLLKKKHVYRRKKQPTPLNIRQRNPSLAVSAFLDMSLWEKEQWCCGTIFRGPFGEAVIDARFITPCANSRIGLKCSIGNITDSASSASGADASSASGAGASADAKSSMHPDLMDATTTKLSSTASSVDLDEGFFDKAVASPASAASSSASTSSAMSGTSSPPPPVEIEDGIEEIIEDEDEEEIDDDEEGGGTT